VLSAIVWIRRGVAGVKNSSAVYLAALSINDVVFLLFGAVKTFASRGPMSLPVKCSFYLAMSAYRLEPLLVLSFSVERLIAILRPLQVGPVLCSFVYFFLRVLCELLCHFNVNCMFLSAGGGQH